MALGKKAQERRGGTEGELGKEMGKPSAGSPGMSLPLEY